MRNTVGETQKSFISITNYNLLIFHDKKFQRLADIRQNPIGHLFNRILRVTIRLFERKSHIDRLIRSTSLHKQSDVKKTSETGIGTF